MSKGEGVSKIEVGGIGGQWVKLDGLDISNISSAVDINLRPGGRIEASIDLIIDEFNIDSSDLTVSLNGDKHSLGSLEPLYDLLKSHFEVAQALEGKGGEESYMKFGDGKLEVKGKINK